MHKVKASLRRDMCRRTTMVTVLVTLLLATTLATSGVAAQEGSMASAIPAALAQGTPDEPRVIEMQTSQTGFVDGDRPLDEIVVTPGETVRFVIDNTAGVKHNFYIGTDEELSVPLATTEVGIEDWIRRDGTVRELEWQVPDDITGLRFGCTIFGHYETMQGTFRTDGEEGSTDATTVADDSSAGTTFPEVASHFGERFTEINRAMNDAWAAGADPAPGNHAMADWADAYVASVLDLGLAESHPDEVAAFVEAHEAYAAWLRETADVEMSQRDEADVVAHTQARLKAQLALQQAIASAE